MAPVTETHPVIDIHNAPVYRGRTRVFDGLNLRIEAGQSTAILGPNGAGKSTLLRLLSQELFPVKTAGSHVKIHGKSRWNVRTLRQHMGIVSHDLQFAYKGWVTGADIVLSGFDASIGIWPHQSFTDAQRARADEVIEALGIVSLRDRRLETMSTGEQRRFLLGRALVHNPDVLVLDEPTSGLDLKACFQYIDVIRQQMNAGKTVVLVTHHVHEIPPEINHVVLIQHGKVMLEGRKADILTNDTLSQLFDTPLSIVEANGFYQVLPR